MTIDKRDENMYGMGGVSIFHFNILSAVRRATGSLIYNALYGTGGVGLFSFIISILYICSPSGDWQIVCSSVSC